MSARSRARPWWGPRRPPAPVPKAEPETIEWLVLPMERPMLSMPEPGPEPIPLPPKFIPMTFAELMEGLALRGFRRGR